MGQFPVIKNSTVKLGSIPSPLPLFLCDAEQIP